MSSNIKNNGSDLDNQFQEALSELDFTKIKEAFDFPELQDRDAGNSSRKKRNNN